jgi:hypothetical protein
VLARSSRGVSGRSRGISWKVVGIGRIVIGAKRGAVYPKRRELPKQAVLCVARMQSGLR